MANEFVKVLDKIGSEFMHGLQEVDKYLIPAAKLAEFLFPSYASTIAADSTQAIAIAGVIQNTVALVQQKWTASKAADETGSQRLNDVMAIVEPVVMQQLVAAGITNATTTYVQGLVNAVVALLNVPTLATS